MAAASFPHNSPVIIITHPIPHFAFLRLPNRSHRARPLLPAPFLVQERAGLSGGGGDSLSASPSLFSFLFFSALTAAIPQCPARASTSSGRPAVSSWSLSPPQGREEDGKADAPAQLCPFLRQRSNSRLAPPLFFLPRTPMAEKSCACVAPCPSARSLW